MDPSEVAEKMKSMSPEERAELAKMMDEQLDDYMEQMEQNSSKYMDGWSPDNWEQVSDILFLRQYMAWHFLRHPNISPVKLPHTIPGSQE